MFKDVKLYRVFKREVAQRLRKSGFEIIDAEVNKFNSCFVVYYFEDTPQFRKCFEKIQRELKEGK